MCAFRQRLLNLFCCFTATAWAVRIGEQQGGDPSDEWEVSPEEVTKIAPIPGSQTWYKVNKLAKSVHSCGGKKYCCIRGCRYLVEKDACGECQGHNVQQPTPEEEVKQYQATMGNFRIPTGIRFKSFTKHSTKCIDKDQKKVRCCTAGFIFDFETRQCKNDLQNTTIKEEPIPGTEAWGLIRQGRYKTQWIARIGTHAKKCVWHPKKWCCNRGCEYILEKDECGNCRSYAEGKPTPPKVSIRKFIAENGNYVIPRSIHKPRANGVCMINHAKKCVAQGSTVGQCCCHAGYYFSFASRRCLEPAQRKEELQKDEEEDEEAEERAATDGPTAEELEQQNGTEDKEEDKEESMARAMANASRNKDDDSGAGQNGLSLLLLVATALPWW